MSYLYTVMQTDVSQFLGSGASYADNKLLLKGLTSNEANAYLGEVYRVDELGFNPDNDEELEGLSIGELSQIADDLTIDIITEEEFNIGTLTVFSKSQGQEQLADYFGVSHVTLIAIEKRQPEVSLAYKKGKAKAIANIAGNLIAKANSGNIPAQMFYLKTQAGWKETTRIETTESGKASNRHFIDE